MSQKPQGMANHEMSSYFNSLPAFVQENIMQTSVEFQSMQELRDCAQKLQTK